MVRGITKPPLARRVDRPEPGFFKMRLVKGGPVVPARIFYGPTPDPENGMPLDRSWLYSAEINGEADPNPLPSPNARVMQVWTTGICIDQTEYLRLLADRAWAARYAPQSPEANPKRRVDRDSINPSTLF